MKRIGCLAVLGGTLLMLLGPAPASAGNWAHARDGWMLGFNVGGGSAGGQVDQVNGPVLVSTDRTGGGAGNFRVGYAVSPSVVLGLESNGWLRDENALLLGSTFSVTTTLSVVALGATWYPSEGGFFVRGGIGAGRVKQEFDLGGGQVEWDETGVGLLAAVGYEWRLTRRFALGPQLDLAYLNVGQIKGTDENGQPFTADVEFNYVNVGLLFNWYF